MDRPTCKLCFRRFPNGRALGGHMRSHILSASTATKQQQVTHQPRRGYGNSPTSSSSSGPHQPSVAVADAGVKIHVPASYGLRENPRKSAKLADPEFSNPDDEELPGYYYGSSYYYHNNHQQQQPLHHSASSAVVQDGESETETSMAAAACVGAVVRRRSKRRRREDSIRVLFPSPGPDTRAAVSNNNKAHDDEQAPVSSVSDATPDEDVALCLVMLSRDTWSVKGEQQNQRHQEVGTGGDGQEEEEEASYDDFDEDDLPIAASGSGSRRGGGGRSRFRCGTCKRTFRSYQALGGHRASHKKAKPWNAHAVDEEDGYQYPNKQSIRGDRIRMKHEEEEEVEEARGDDDDDYSEATGSAAAVPAPDPRIHQCPFCSRVFASGQALGGHKRSHFTYSSSNNYSYLPPPAPRHAGEQSSRGGNANAVGVSPATRNNSNYRRRRDEQLGESFLDLNLPAPLDELDAEVSAVSIAN